jgi:RNA polymerase sigma-70 factor (ECF subfamily)
MEDPENDPAARDDSDALQQEFKLLVQRGQNGDQEAIGLLLSKYRNYLLLIANQDLDQAMQAKLGASDVVQQTMILVQQNFAQFRGTSELEFKSWIRKILQNDLLSVRRHYGAAKRRQVNREVQLQDSRNHPPDLLDRAKTPQSNVLMKELAEEMERCLGELSESHRHIIRLRNWDEKSFSEIGTLLNCSSDAARKLWFRAFNRLKDIVLKSRPEFASHLLQISHEQSIEDAG